MLTYCYPVRKLSQMGSVSDTILHRSVYRRTNKLREVKHLSSERKKN